ncbi:hypothetical protein ACTXT7_008318 [Hymenolepis weldensis]
MFRLSLIAEACPIFRPELIGGVGHSRHWACSDEHRSGFLYSDVRADHLTLLVRYRKEDGAYVLSLMYENEPRHYKIEQHLNRLSIEGGQYFETLIE